MGAIIGVLVGAVLLLLFRKVLGALVPLVYTIGCIGALILGVAIEIMGRGSGNARFVALITAAIVVVLVGIPMIVYAMILTARGRIKSLESRVDTVEKYLEENN